MPSRAELNVRAWAMGFDPSTMPNDSKLEQKVIFLETNQTAVAISATAPTTTLTTSGVFSDGETITFGYGAPLGNIVYTFKTALTSANSPYQVLIGAAATNTLDNLKDAINGTAAVTTPGVGYGQLTPRNPGLTAGTKTASTLVITSTDTNILGSIATSKTTANATFTAATMSAGTLGGIVATNTNTGVRDTLGALAGGANTGN